MSLIAAIVTVASIVGCWMSKDEVQRVAMETIKSSLIENLAKHPSEEVRAKLIVDRVENCVLMKSGDNTYTGMADVWFRWKGGDKISVKYSVNCTVDGNQVLTTCSAADGGGSLGLFILNQAL